MKLIEINKDEHEVYLNLFGKRHVWKHGTYQGWYRPDPKELYHKCNRCSKEFVVGSDEEGVPNGMGFIKMVNGHPVELTLCRECITELGGKWNAEKFRFEK